MLTLDRNAASVAAGETAVSPTAPSAERSSLSLTTRERELIAALIEPVAMTVQIDEPAIDPEVRRWMPLVVPMFAVLISVCTLAIWSIL